MIYNDLIHLLEKNGWIISSERNGHIHFRHPNQKDEISLAGGRKKNVPKNVLNYVFSIAKIIAPEYNSVEYYENRIKELLSEKERLQEELQQCNGSTEDWNQLKSKLKAAEEKINRLEESKGIVEQKKDAQKEWKNKIETSFDILGNKSEIIQKEYNRLKIMFYSSLFFTIVSIFLFGYFGFCTYFHFTTPDVQIKSFWDYFPYCSLYPIIGIILWISIYQMNKSQRQLIVIAEQIQSINYIEGLLLALNFLSPDIESAIERINKAIDKIMDNYLTIQCQNTCNEEKLQSIENKDRNVIPINTVKSLLETVLKNKS